MTSSDDKKLKLKPPSRIPRSNKHLSNDPILPRNLTQNSILKKPIEKSYHKIANSTDNSKIKGHSSSSNIQYGNSKLNDLPKNVKILTQSLNVPKIKKSSHIPTLNSNIKSKIKTKECIKTNCDVTKNVNNDKFIKDDEDIDKNIKEVQDIIKKLTFDDSSFMIDKNIESIQQESHTSVPNLFEGNILIKPEDYIDMLEEFQTIKKELNTLQTYIRNLDLYDNNILTNEPLEEEHLLHQSPESGSFVSVLPNEANGSFIDSGLDATQLITSTSNELTSHESAPNSSYSEDNSFDACTQTEINPPQNSQNSTHQRNLPNYDSSTYEIRKATSRIQKPSIINIFNKVS